MQIAASKLNSFLKSPDPKIQCILVYGPDEGLVKERSTQLAKTVVNDLSDPFLVVDLDGDGLKSDPARLHDEAAAISMMGGRRVIRIRSVTDSNAKLFAEFFENPVGDALIIVSGGDLAKSSKLRQAFEKSKTVAACIACYADELRDLDGVIRDHFRNECVEVSNDAIGYLATHMGSSRGTTRAELEKLVLYAGNSKRLSLEDVTEAIGDTSAFSIDMAVNAAMSGEAKKLDLVLDKLWEDSISPVALIRAATGHLLKIQKVQANMEEGMGLNDAVSALRPPIFWKIKDQFGRQCKLWNKFICAKALTILLDAERNCKKTNIPAETITARAFQQLAAYARQSGRR